MKTPTGAMVTSLLAAASAQNAAAAPNCPTGSGVSMIVARASNENPGTGVMGSVANDVAKQIPGSTITAVDYPATLKNYQQSEGQGVTAMTALVNQFATGCPDSQMVLMGYSQGAQVTADVLCGTAEQNFAKTSPVNNVNNVAAVVLMGDPSHVASAPFNAGTSKNDGIFPRQNVASCAPVADRMVSFCNTGDTFCDRGNSPDVHLSYVQSNGPQAVQFIVEKVKAGGAASNSTKPAIAKRLPAQWHA